MSEHTLYRDLLLEEYQHPRNAGPMTRPDCSHHEENPLCGDQMTVFLKLDPKRMHVTDVSFVGRGCVISQAAASLFTEHIKGKTVTEITAMDDATIVRLLGVTPNPMRMKCAVLVLQTTAKALAALKVTKENETPVKVKEKSGEMNKKRIKKNN